jgi:hypothetical protein
MEINVDYLQKLFKNDKKNKIINEKREEKLYSKIVEYSFFIQNELSVSKIINENLDITEKNGFFRYLTVEDHNFIKIGETFEHNTNILNHNYNKYVILKYKYSENTDYRTFINSFIDYENKSIFWNLLEVYELFIKNILFLTKREKTIKLLDFSTKNLFYDEQTSCIFMRNFEKTYINNGNINDFISLVEKIDYFGNKHFDLFFAKEIVTKKDLFIILNNFDIIMDNYIDNLYFLKFFSQKIKNEIKINWKKFIKSNSVFERNNKNNEMISSNDWRSFLSLYLNFSQMNSSIWETFSVNSLFLNISVSLVKFFKIEDKNSILHKYIQFLFNNLDFKNTVSMETNREKYYNFMGSLNKEINLENYNLTILKNCSFQQKNELYEYLFSNIDYF